MLSRRVFSFLLLIALPLPAFPGDKDDAKPVNLEKLNTAADEVDPFMVNGTTLLYATPNADGKYELRLSTRASAAGAWKAGKTWRDLSFKTYDCRSPFVFKGVTLFFAQNKVPDKKF